jgi:hypothetical protein
MDEAEGNGLELARQRRGDVPMSEVIGPFTIDGTKEQIDAISDTAKKLAGALPDQLKDVDVVFRSGDQLKKKAHTAFTPRGLTPNGHRILMHERVDKYDADRTFAHEVMHALDFQWLTNKQRRDITGLMEPLADKWDAKEYHNRVYEAFACYASAAFGEFKWPVYTEFYVHDVPKKKWPELKTLVLEDLGPADPAPDPDPTPSDDRDERIVELEAQLAQCEAKVAGQH